MEAHKEEASVPPSLSSLPMTKVSLGHAQAQREVVPKRVKETGDLGRMGACPTWVAVKYSGERQRPGRRGPGGVEGWGYNHRSCRLRLSPFYCCQLISASVH